MSAQVVTLHLTAGGLRIPVAMMPILALAPRSVLKVVVDVGPVNEYDFGLLAVRAGDELYSFNGDV
jgi:hypothetical protein